MRNPLLLLIAGAALLVAFGLFVWRWQFVARAEEADGQVVAIQSSNGRCGSKHKHDCTRFTAVIEFSAEGGRHRTTTSAGDARGHGASTSGANHHVGQHLPVLYDPANPDNAVHDSVFDVWGAPIVALMTSGVCGVGGVLPQRRRR